MTLTKNDSKKIAIMAARAGDAKKASPVSVYDLGGSSSLVDFVVLLMVDSAPQLDAVQEEVSVQLKAENHFCLYRDGTRSKNWKVLDYGSVMVHVFDGKAEEFYSIIKLYAEHKPVQWEENAPAAKPTEPAKPAAAKPEIIESASAPAKKAAAKPAAKKPAAKKAPAKKAAVKPAAKKAAVKPAAKKAAAKKPAAKKTAVKPAAKKAPVKKAAVKPAAKKPAAKKSAVKKAAVKKPAPKKAAASKTKQAKKSSKKK